MTMIGVQRPDAKAEVTLGVDTHLDVHVAVAWTVLADAWASSECAHNSEGLRGAAPLG
jgi:hypothetical protein